jgi:uncharacterized protein YbjT (DUF2867 family)
MPGMTTSLKALVTGATGKQGGGVARLLLSRGHSVRAVTRKPSSPAAIALARLGAELVAADLTDRDAMERAACGRDAVFLVATPFEAGTGAEITQGTSTADAARAAGAFLLYSSVGNADRHTGIPHFDSKYAVEQHIRSIGVPATILGPAYFMENLTYLQAQMRNNVYPTPLTPNRKLAQISLADIAAAAVTVLEHRERYAGKRFDISGDAVSANDTIRILSELTGRSFRHYQLPMDMVRGTMGEDGVRMFEYFERTGYHVDREESTREFPELRWTSFEAWARAFDWDAFLSG